MDYLTIGECLTAIVILLWGIYAARSWGAADTPGYKSTTEYFPGPIILLTADVLEQINSVRHSFGDKRLNVAGFRNAIGIMADWPLERPKTRLEWVTYLILFETNRNTSEAGLLWDGLTITKSIVIEPHRPYNGQPRATHGAGRPSHWHWNDVTPARVLAGEILRQAQATRADRMKKPPVDPYEKIARQLYGCD